MQNPDQVTFQWHDLPRDVTARLDVLLVYGLHAGDQRSFTAFLSGFWRLEAPCLSRRTPLPQCPHRRAWTTRGLPYDLFLFFATSVEWQARAVRSYWVGGTFSK